eukprot:s1419_g6.t1
MLRVLRRCRELLRVTVPVERLLATWSGIARGTFQLPPRLRRLVCLAGSVPFSRPAVRTLLELFSHELETTLAHERAVRLQLWARRMRASVGSCHGWLKRRPASQGSVLGDAARLVAPTANFSEQFKAMLLAWSPVFNKFADGEPDAEAFFAQFGSVMASSSMPHTALTGSRLREAVSSSALTAAGLDGWSFAALKAVAACCPALFDELALLLQLVEDTGCWPYSMTCAAVALIPKDSSISEPGPSDLRPLSILSCLYRLWAKARLSDIVPWQDRWLADGAFGFRPGHSAEGLFFATALDLEAAEAEGHPCAGISFDLKKAFDALPPCLLIQILRRRGCAECILRPLAGFYRHLHRRFRLNGVLGREFHSSSGIPQGCPISPFCLNAILGVWLEHVGHTVPAAVPRSFADDLSVVTSAPAEATVVRTLKQESPRDRAAVKLARGAMQRQRESKQNSKKERLKALGLTPNASPASVRTTPASVASKVTPMTPIGQLLHRAQRMAQRGGRLRIGASRPPTEEREAKRPRTNSVQKSRQSGIPAAMMADLL